MKITKYPDGTSYATVPNSEPELTYSGEFTYRINSYEDLWHLNQIVEALNSFDIEPHVTIPWLIDGQADRRFGVGQSSGLKLVLEFLNNMIATFSIFHPHNAELVEMYLGGSAIIPNHDFIRQVLSSLDSVDLTDSLTLMSLDAGGFKPLMKLCDEIGWKGETYSASKSREFVEDKTKITHVVDKQDFGGKDVLIIDDICIYGGSLKGVAKILRGRNVGKLYAAVSHMTVRILGSDPVTKYFDKVFTTNSKYNNYYVGPTTGYTDAPSNLQVINLFP